MRKRQSLSLNRETVRELSGDRLSEAAGGFISLVVGTGPNTCPIIFGALSAAALGHCISDIRLTCGCFT